MEQFNANSQNFPSTTILDGWQIMCHIKTSIHTILCINMYVCSCRCFEWPVWAKEQSIRKTDFQSRKKSQIFTLGEADTRKCQSLFLHIRASFYYGSIFWNFFWVLFNNTKKIVFFDYFPQYLSKRERSNYFDQL